MRANDATARSATSHPREPAPTRGDDGTERRGFRDAGEEKRELMEAEIARLEQILDGVDDDMRSIPRLIVLAVSALPVGWLWGLGWALFAVFSTFVVMGTAAYLTLVRRNEYRYNLDLIRKELARVSGRTR